MVDIVSQVLSFLASLFVFVLGAGIIGIAVMYVIDITQSSSAVRRNFPVVGRFRYFFEELGEFFRQYFFAMDREEMPFNRAERSWAYRAAKGVDSTVAFGSTRDLTRPGTAIFVNCPWPMLDEDVVEASPVTIGATCQRPYTTDRVVHIYAMS
jgi:hypothetical protein